MVTIKSVSKVTTGKTPSKKIEKYFGGDIPFISPSELGNFKYVLPAKQTLTVSGAAQIKLVPKNSILVCCIGSLGKLAIADRELGTNQQINSVTFDENKVCPEFGYYALSRLKPILVSMAPATTVAIVNKSKFEELEIPLPSLDEQKRIAAILDKADAIRRKRQQAIQLADDFLRSVFLDMFGDPVTNPKGWEVKKFGEVIDVLTDYHANGSYKTLVKNVTLFDEPNFAYMVRTTDLEKKNYTESVKYIDQHAYEHLSKSKVFGGEIIMNKIGSAGAVYLMPNLNKPVSLAMNQFMIRCNELSTNEFMYYQLKTDAGAREIAKRVQGAVTKTITKDAVRDVSVIVPPIELQNKFIEIVGKIKKLKIGINDSYELTRSEFNSLSQKAFAGEL